jgi:Flp pilus assembly protein TadD
MISSGTAETIRPDRRRMPGESPAMHIAETAPAGEREGPEHTVPCACGSGLSRARCCGFDLGGAASGAEASDEALRAAARALRAYREGAHEAAEAACLGILEAIPDQSEALRVLHEIRKAQGRQAAAHVLIRRLVRLRPNDVAATIELALSLMAKGDMAEAEVHARNAIRLAPLNPSSHNVLGMILTEAHKQQAGEHHYRAVLTLTGNRDPILLANLAWNLTTQGRMEEARQLYHESVAAAPNVRQTLLGWARLEEADRQYGKCAEILDRAEAVFPGDTDLLLMRARLCRRRGRYPEALAALGRIEADRAPDVDDLSEKGAVLDRMGRYDEAFAAFRAAKQKARDVDGDRYQAEEAARLVGRLRGFFTAGRLNILPRAAVVQATPQPIFILGFPRSGTTLLEQILSGHPAITAGDELPLIHELTEAMPRLLASPLAYPDALAELWLADKRDGLDQLRDDYLRRARQLGVVQPGATWFTDKMPLNETHLGLIALIFPEAPLIHVLRHPLDVVLSVFSNNLTHGFYCAYDLETAARHYVLVSELLEHYRREMTLRYLPLRYEDMVLDHEASVRRVLSFIGATFDEKCLRFHENRRYARTASYAQVSEPLYDRSVFRYRNYLEHLRPVIPILEPVITRLGYTIE